MTISPERDNFGRSEDPRMHRLWNPVTKQYLHLSANGETPDVAQSWLGFQHQAHTQRARAIADSKPWPYVRRARYQVEQKVPSFEQAEGMA